MLYNVFLDRASDEGGKVYWLELLGNGVSREYVFHGFAESQEFTNICNFYNVERGSVTLSQARDQNPKLTAYVNRMYTKALDRAGEFIKNMLYNETNMEPYQYYYDVFIRDDLYGIVAIYQYDSAFMQGDNCQVWYCDGETAFQLFKSENTSGNAFCNVLDSFIYKDASGRPYVVMQTWRRVARSWNSVNIFGSSHTGFVGDVFEASGTAKNEDGNAHFIRGRAGD